LLRADGRSIYQRHGGVRYATHAQLSLEERMLALARATGAPRMTRADAARALGADLAQLETALTGRAPDAHGERTRTGLREDQAAAALAVLTNGRRVSVINAPAGSGKTWAQQARRGPQPDSAVSSASRRPSQPATPWPPGSLSRTTPPSSWATCPASAAPAARFSSSPATWS
jgi:hypothetical protein